MGVWEWVCCINLDINNVLLAVDTISEGMENKILFVNKTIKNAEYHSIKN